MINTRNTHDNNNNENNLVDFSYVYLGRHCGGENVLKNSFEFEKSIVFKTTTRRTRELVRSDQRS